MPNDERPPPLPLQRALRDPLLGRTISGRYRVEELIGQGGMGKVYRARHLALDRVVVLKVLKPALLADATLVGRFEREAKAASRLNHPNVIQVLDFGRSDPDGSLYIAMEHVAGIDLRALLRDGWPVPEERLCRILAQVCDALSEAHARNVIHRDLKPENVMIEQRRDHPDHVKVLDFGIAKILDGDVAGLTRSDVVCGTPQYMAPEQATGTGLDARSDVYAVGVILYQMVTGSLPFEGTSSMDILTKHVHEEPVPPRLRRPDANVTPALEALILRTLRKEPADRPQTAAELRDLLLALAQRPTAPRTSAPAMSVPGTSASATSAPALSAPARRRRLASRLAVALVSAVAAAVVAGAVFLALRPPRAPASVQLSSVAGAGRDAARARELVQRAAEWQAANDAVTARELLEKAAELDPANAEAHFRLGSLYLASQPQRGRAELEKARGLDATRYGASVDALLNR